MNAGDDPEFGPGGYLPDRAARRARKIVLRAPMGIHWVWGAIGVGVVVVVVGLVFLATRGGPPGPPFVELGRIAEVSEASRTGVLVAGESKHLVVGDTGRLRIFDFPAPDVRWCPESQRFEGPTGVWSATGRGLGGAASLLEHPSVIVDDIVYWDPNRTITGPLPDPTPTNRSC